MSTNRLYFYRTTIFKKGDIGNLFNQINNFASNTFPISQFSTFEKLRIYKIILSRLRIQINSCLLSSILIVSLSFTYSKIIRFPFKLESNSTFYLLSLILSIIHRLFLFLQHNSFYFLIYQITIAFRAAKNTYQNLTKKKTAN